MKNKLTTAVLGAGLTFTCMALPANAEVISGSSSGEVFPFGNFDFSFGDGEFDIHIYYDMRSFTEVDNPSLPEYERTCWFVSTELLDPDLPWRTVVALAPGVTAIDQITDASSFDVADEIIFAHDQTSGWGSNRDGVGDFVVMQDTLTGFWGVIQLESMHTDGPEYIYADINWWFQTDGTADFSSVPSPASAAILGFGGIMASSRRRR